MTFDPEAYWLQAGVPALDAYPEQKAVLGSVLDALMPLGSVLEVGCGQGRITQLLVSRSSDVTVFDLNPDNVRVTLEAFPQVKGFVADLRSWRPQRRWDTVVAIEVLMHIPPADVGQAVSALRQAVLRRLVTCDWVRPVRAAHNWMYDYSALLGPKQHEVAQISWQAISVTEA